MQSTQITKNGFALSIVLWIVAALLFGIATLATLAKDNQLLTSGVHQKLKTQLIAEDILESLKFYILTADYDSSSFINTNLSNIKYKLPDKITVDNRWYSINKNIQIRIQDTSSMINVLRIPEKLIAFIATKKEQRQLQYVIADSIKDYKDTDNVVSLNGAESSTYERIKNVNYKIRNSPALQHPQELRLINGIDTLNNEKWEQVKDKLYYGRFSSANIMLIDYRYLSYILKIDESYAKLLIDIRNNNTDKFIKIIQKLDNYDSQDVTFSLSKQLNIEIKVSYKKATTILNSMMNFEKSNKKLLTVINYKIR